MKDRAIPAGLPKAFRGQDQIDGTKTNMMAPSGQKGLQDRSAAPSRASDSGMERAMGAQADELHSSKR